MEETLESLYEIGQQLGEGAEGVVRLCTHKITGLRYACKSVVKSHDWALRRVRREIATLAQLKHAGPHPNVVHMQETLEDADSVHIIMELCEGGTLLDYVSNSVSPNQRLSETQAVHFFSAIVQAVCFCHGHRITHRDIKLENVLLTCRPLSNSGSTDYGSLIRLADFGASADIRHDVLLDDVHGTMHYLAPEVFQFAGTHDERVDVWSLGVLLYTLLCGYYPFDGNTPAEIVKAITRGRVDLLKREPWPSISSLAKDLITSMLQRNPARRIRLNQILSHPWLHKSQTLLQVSTSPVRGLPCNPQNADTVLELPASFQTLKV